jgi:hypothetical protein
VPRCCGVTGRTASPATRCTSACSRSTSGWLLAPTFWSLVLFPAAVLLVLWGAIHPEERFLHKRFGAPYDDYTRRVHRWLQVTPTYNRYCRRPVCRRSNAVTRIAMGLF